MAALPDDETIEHFGRELYGDAWISSLTERERWLLDKYERYWVDPPATKEGTNLFAGITWTDVEYDERIRMVRGRWLILPSNPALAREVEEAVSRRDRIDYQRSEVLHHLQNGAGFSPAVRRGGEAQQARPQYSSKLTRIEHGVHEAALKLWSDGVPPPGLRAKDRDERLRQQMIADQQTPASKQQTPASKQQTPASKRVIQRYYRKMKATE